MIVIERSTARESSFVLRGMGLGVRDLVRLVMEVFIGIFIVHEFIGFLGICQGGFAKIFVLGIIS